jgi:hypothetical protein
MVIAKPLPPLIPPAVPPVVDVETVFDIESVTIIIPPPPPDFPAVVEPAVPAEPPGYVTLPALDIVPALLLATCV